MAFKSLLLGSLGLLVVTGLLLAPTTLDFRLAWDVPWRLSGIGRVAAMSAHVAVSYLLLSFLGALWQAHIRAGLKKASNRLSGVLMIAFLLALAGTGVGVLYLGGQDWADAAALAHLAAGLLVPLVMLWHLAHKRLVRAAHTVSSRTTGLACDNLSH